MHELRLPVQGIPRRGSGSTRTLGRAHRGRARAGVYDAQRSAARHCQRSRRCRRHAVAWQPPCASSVRHSRARAVFETQHRDDSAATCSTYASRSRSCSECFQRRGGSAFASGSPIHAERCAGQGAPAELHASMGSPARSSAVGRPHRRSGSARRHLATGNHTLGRTDSTTSTGPRVADGGSCLPRNSAGHLARSALFKLGSNGNQPWWYFANGPDGKAHPAGWCRLAARPPAARCSRQ